MPAHLLKDGGKAEKHGSDADKGTDGETEHGLPGTADKKNDAHSRTQEKGIEYKVILGHEAQEDDQSDPGFPSERGGTQLLDA